MTVADYRHGNEKEKNLRKITGLNKSTDVTLKRGVISSRNLYQWLNDIRDGNRNALCDEELTLAYERLGME